MDEIIVNLEPKPFRNLLQALQWKLFPDLTPLNVLTEIQSNDPRNIKAFAHDTAVSLYQNVPIERSDVETEIEVFEQILKKASHDHWEVDQLNGFLDKRSFPADQTRVFVEFWRKESEKIHHALLRDVTINDSLNKVLWRVDTKAMSKSAPEVNEPIAYFELLTQHSKAAGGRPDAVQFDMDRNDIQQMLKSLNDIQDSWDKIATQQTNK